MTKIQKMREFEKAMDSLTYALKNGVVAGKQGFTETVKSYKEKMNEAYDKLIEIAQEIEDLS